MNDPGNKFIDCIDANNQPAKAFQMHLSFIKLINLTITFTFCNFLDIVRSVQQVHYTGMNNIC
jgi:hypothetical protein